MSDMGAAEEDPCQGERDLLQALLDSWAELGVGSKGENRDASPLERPSSSS